MFNKKLGTYLKKIRKNKNLTVRKAAEDLNLSPSYISNIENGRRNNPTPEVLKIISNYYQVNFDELLSMSDIDVNMYETIKERINANDRLKTKLSRVSHYYPAEEVFQRINMGKRTQAQLSEYKLDISSVLAFEQEIDQIEENIEATNKVDNMLKVKYDAHIPSGIRFTKTENTGPLKEIKPVRINPEEAQYLNDLYTLLSYDINHYWKGKLLNEKQKEDIKKILDIITEQES
ncbi:MAG TPA: helix-turn-helix domain-containing protein [Virgibacillus sp.]|nr:helix-turn-helix domain-containing protein [Virgibacillus sp.]HLR66902.1 helix-turn-helix domain-containing protein [Virgibacillus sp.]